MEDDLSRRLNDAEENGSRRPPKSKRGFPPTWDIGGRRLPWKIEGMLGRRCEGEVSSPGVSEAMLVGLQLKVSRLDYTR